MATFLSKILCCGSGGYIPLSPAPRERHPKSCQRVRIADEPLGPHRPSGRRKPIAGILRNPTPPNMWPSKINKALPASPRDTPVPLVTASTTPPRRTPTESTHSPVQVSSHPQPLARAPPATPPPIRLPQRDTPVLPATASTVPGPRTPPAHALNPPQPSAGTGPPNQWTLAGSATQPRATPALPPGSPVVNLPAPQATVPIPPLNWSTASAASGSPPLANPSPSMPAQTQPLHLPRFSPQAGVAADDGVGYGPPSPNFPNRSTGWTSNHHRSAHGFIPPSPPSSSTSSCGSSAPERRPARRAARKESPAHSESTHQHHHQHQQQPSCMLCTFCPHHQPLVDALLAQASSHAREPQIYEWPQPSVFYSVPPQPSVFYPATLPPWRTSLPYTPAQLLCFSGFQPWMNSRVYVQQPFY
ncbi:hypothetical protein DFH06DRAFT_1210715 [Mycena polygramma]|nr:hypothetical protein DFH06DRAFT_1210715 [Mycena polygramma]